MSKRVQRLFIGPDFVLRTVGGNESPALINSLLVSDLTGTGILYRTPADLVRSFRDHATGAVVSDDFVEDVIAHYLLPDPI